LYFGVLPIDSVKYVEQRAKPVVRLGTKRGGALIVPGKVIEKLLPPKPIAYRALVRELLRPPPICSPI
jgi:hypothetical protein